MNMKTKVLFMLLALPLIFTACSNDDEEEVPLGGVLASRFQSEVGFYNADGTEYNIEQYADDLDDCEITCVMHYDESRDDYVWGSRFDERFDSIVGNRMYVEMSFVEYVLNTHLEAVDFYLKLRSDNLFGNENEHVIRMMCDGQKMLHDDEGFITSVDSQTLPITWQAAYEKPSSWNPTLSIRVVLPAQ